MAFTMAPAFRSNSSYIDLTGDEENDDSITKTDDACQRFIEAASRLTNSIGPLNSPKPIAFQNPGANNDSLERKSLSVTAHKSLRPSLLGNVSKPVRGDTHKVKNEGKNNAIPRQTSSVPESTVAVARSAPDTATSVSGSARPPSMLHRTERNQNQPKETKFVPSGTDTMSIRRPRSAAISARQSITQTCSEWEQWVDKDPDLIPQQNGISTSKRPVRSDDDLNEWSPKSNTKTREEEQKQFGRTSTNSPTPLAGKHNESTANGNKSLSHTQAAPIPLGTKKRKFSGSSQFCGSSAKITKWDEKPGIRYESPYSNLAERAESERIHDETRSKSLAGSSSKITVELNDRSLSEPSNVNFGKNGQSTKPATPHTHVDIDPRLQQRSYAAFDTAPSEPDPASTEQTVYAALFNSKVYPVIVKLKVKYEGKLPREDLDAIGKIVVEEVRNNLAKQPENSSQLDDATQKRVKEFVKKSYRKKIRHAVSQTSHKAVALTDDPQLIATTASSNPLSRGDNTLSGSVLAESHLPPAPSLSHPENALSSEANVVNGKEEARASQYPHPQTSDQQSSSPLQQSPKESSTSFFAPGFDRGRYPALRRRRGNKYYTPTRTPKKNSVFEQIHHTSFNYISQSGLSNGKDQVWPLKATADQYNALGVSLTKATAFTTATEPKRFITHQDIDSGPFTSTDGPIALLPSSAQSWGSVIQMEEPCATSGGEVFSHVAKPQTSIGASQSAHQIPRKRLLEDSSSRRQPRPIFCPKPATALDPSLEHVIAVSITDTTSRPSDDEQKYHITPADQTQLVADQSIVKHIDFSLKVGKPKLVRIETKVIDPVHRPGNCISSLLRNRELGLASRGPRVGTVHQLHQLKSEMLEPWKNWKGASGDVVAVAWHPDSNVYAFGAAAHTNVEDIQYNRPCNLLLGNLTSNQIRELPDHRVDRPKPETILNGPNSTQAVYDACDPKVYETVTSIAFSPTGDRMYTASHDRTVKIWDVSTKDHQCLSTLNHEAWVTSLEISKYRPGLFATASKCVKDSVRIYHDSCVHVNFSASRAETRPEWKIYPECLRWGPNSHTSHLLLAGFQQWEQQGDFLSGGGQLCLYDAHAFANITVTPSSQSVYAAAWHPTEPFFATGGAPGNNVTDKINTKSVVRVWDVRTPKRCYVEYECPATDMQDITFSPSNSNIVTAGCTDGSSYIWDWRCPDEFLHHLKHGKPLAELDHTRVREEADTGVMLSVWGPGGSLFYTGSSDGVIKAWDVRRHPKDVLISNVANFGVSIQSGAFSPDGDHLLVGDAEGGIHILSSAPSGPRSNNQRTDAYIELVRASDGSGIILDQGDDDPGTEGIQAAKSLVDSSQLEYHKEFGVGQGLNYQGPFATWARKEPGEAPIGRLRKKYEKKQPISKRNEKRWDIAIPMTSLLHERKVTLDRKKGGHNMTLDGLNKRESTTAQPSKGGAKLPADAPTSTPKGAFAIVHTSADECVGAGSAGGDKGRNVEDNTISESEMVEENFWWTRMGEDEINEARAGRIRA